MTTPGTYVDGAWGGAGRPLAVRNPADVDELVAEIDAGDAATVAAACAAAAQAAPGWGATPGADRARLLDAFARELEACGDAIARDLVREEGKTLAEAGGEVRRAAQSLRYYAQEALAPLGDVLPPARPGAVTMTRRRPVGPVALITPFNFPLLVPAWKLAPALAYGNTVVWKPSELTPLTALHVVRAAERAGLPPGVLNLVTGGAEVGAALVAAPEIAALSFTGSTAVGRAIERAVAGRGVRLQLEMGGANAAVVLADAPLPETAAALLEGAMGGTGQRCTAIRRAVVERPALAPLAEALRDGLAGWRLGSGLDPGVAMGPLVSAPAADRVLAAVDEARRHGASVVAGGSRPAENGLARGHFVEPTVLAGATAGDEEVFGPLLTLIPVDDLDEAIAVANATRYGLNAAVFTADLARALRFADAAEAGMVHVNATGGVAVHVPFGGIKDSGLGPFEQGRAAAELFTRPRVIHLHPTP
ncbi:MAG TPA: aldehyde dehydrogenase family protein [Capillimicrobium sp.]|nr:aldehyde dehydrogenase family protein [Capillimicrobium sp.]